jgi:GntR family transcriptional regulator
LTVTRRASETGKRVPDTVPELARVSPASATAPTRAASWTPLPRAVLGVNTNTVLRVLRKLRDEGLLECRRGRGITVAGTPEHGIVVAQARDLVRLARKHGYRVDELVRIIESVD